MNTKKPTRTYKNASNRISEVVYETAKDLFAAGAIDKTTMHKFDALCLPEVPRYTAKHSGDTNMLQVQSGSFCKVFKRIRIIVEAVGNRN
jgi:hypothetical protein